MPLIPADPKITRYIPPPVLHKVGGMDEASQQYFFTEYDRKRKTVLTAARFFLIGSHYLYLKRYLLFALFLATSGGAGIWMLVDMFRLRRMVEIYNNRIAMEVLRDIQVLS